MAFIKHILLALVIHAAYAATLPEITRNRQCPIVLQVDVPANPLTSRQITEEYNKAVKHKLDKTPRIVGGDFITSRSLNDVLVSLLSYDSACTGSLISAQWVLSAAHCEFDTTWVAEVGASQIEFDGTVIDINLAINHPRYSENSKEFDIAILRLARPAPTTRFMLINGNPSFPLARSFVRVAGYGKTDYDLPDRFEDERLRQVDLPVVDFNICNDYEEGTLTSSAQMCTGYPFGGCDSCSGDSGGPVFQYDAWGNPVEVGIVSFGPGCAERFSPAVNVRPHYFIPWMRSHGAVFTVSNFAQQVFAPIPGVERQ